MATALPTTNGNSAQNGENNFAVKAGLARMLKGGVIMDVINAEQVRFPPFHLFLLFSLSLASNCLLSSKHKEAIEADGCE